ncbi:CD209 antigen-like protein E [Micropterus dolomieu]|uniref:CD209 antigen-like protein E n=1 Tax=Micropterus dolomieu TaxID=147949 RepID=UPI001E8D19AC|nr:CD209 antigen-like protein E [Micropterus dolomieu]
MLSVYFVSVGPQTPKNRVRRRCFTAATLGVMYLLILAGVFIRYISVTLEKDQLQTRYDKLYNNYSELQGQISAVNISQLQSSYETLRKNHSQLQDEVKQLKDKLDVEKRKWCPEGWKRFGFSCYFKFNEEKTWYNSRSDCQEKGAHLVIINNEEEQKCVTELNKDGDSWIGLRFTRKQTKTGWEWKWEDDSPLTLKFWATGHPHRNNYAAACCDKQGKWTESGYYDRKKNWICEKELSCLS